MLPNGHRHSLADAGNRHHGSIHPQITPITQIQNLCNRRNLWINTITYGLSPTQPAGRTNWRVAFSPQGDTLATCSADGRLVFWDTATGKERGRVSIAVEGPAGYVSSMISAIAFAPTGKTLAAAPQDQTVRLLDVAAKSRGRTKSTVGRLS